MSEALDKKTPPAVPVNPEERAEWERMIRDTYCKNATEMEFALFMQQCQTLSLTPVAGQICQIEMWDPDLERKRRTTIIQIDGFRAVAQRSGQYRGRLGPYWCGPDGVWKDVWLGEGPPVAAKVGILREGFQEPVWGVARYQSYVRNKRDGKPIKNWAVMPDVMLAKCAEAQALRSSFSVLGGVYEPSEVDRFLDGETIDVNPQSPPILQAPTQWTGTKQELDELARRLENAGIPLVPENRPVFKDMRAKLLGIPLEEVEELTKKYIDQTLGGDQ